MTAARRRTSTAEAFVALADSLVGDFDVADVIHGLVRDATRLMDVDAAGLLLLNDKGELHLLASSSEAARLLELFALLRDEGPCVECFDTGQPVSVPDLEATQDRWPNFVRAATEGGFFAVHAVPMRLRDDIIGVMNLFSTTAAALPTDELAVAQALADVATIAILQQRTPEDPIHLLEQMQRISNDRVVIEQAKGLLANSGLDMDEAFAIMRRYARLTDRLLCEVARRLLNRQLDPAEVIAHCRLGRHSNTAGD